jgi:hypothetical protein
MTQGEPSLRYTRRAVSTAHSEVGCSRNYALNSVAIASFDLEREIVNTIVKLFGLMSPQSKAATRPNVRGTRCAAFACRA